MQRPEAPTGEQSCSCESLTRPDPLVVHSSIVVHDWLNKQISEAAALTDTFSSHYKYRHRGVSGLNPDPDSLLWLCNKGVGTAEIKGILWLADLIQLNCLFFLLTGSGLRCEKLWQVYTRIIKTQQQCTRIPVTLPAYSAGTQSRPLSVHTVKPTHRVRAESMSRTSLARCFLCFWMFGISTWERSREVPLECGGANWDEEQTQCCWSVCTPSVAAFPLGWISAEKVRGMLAPENRRLENVIGVA